MKDRGYRNWAGLPPELTSSILGRLDATMILENAQKVCKSWHSVCKDPWIWRKIKMHSDFTILGWDIWTMAWHEAMCRHAVDRSQGGLVEIDIWRFCTDSLLNDIADSSSNLRILRLATCHDLSDDILLEALAKLPLLEEIDISYCLFLEETLKALGKSCPNLKTFKLRSPEGGYEDDRFAIAIAEGMPELRHLQLLGNEFMTNTGLIAILDSCPHLEHLDLRQCSDIDLAGDLGKRCSERIRVLRRPDDSTADLSFEMPR